MRAGQPVRLGDQGMLVEGRDGFLYGIALTGQANAGNSFQVCPLIVGGGAGGGAVQPPLGPPGTLDPPENLAAGTATADSVPLTWDPVQGATGYQVGWKPPNEAEQFVRVSGTGHTLTGLEDGTEYAIRVRTTNAEGDGAWSNTIRKSTLSTLPAPTGFALGTATGTTLPLTWNLRTGATSYDVGWRIGGGTETVASAGNNDNYTITGLTPDTEYDVRIRSVNIVGDGTWSEYSKFRTAVVPLNAPSDLAAGVVTFDSIPLTWTAVDDATGYKIGYKKGSDDEAVVEVSGGATNSHTLTGLDDGEEYTIRIRTVNSAGDGVWSGTITATTIAVTAPAPADFRSSSGRDQLSLFWDAVPGATSYTIGYSRGLLSESTVSVTGTSHVLTGLHFGTTYRLRVRAVNQHGDGLWSDYIVRDTTAGILSVAAPVSLSIEQRHQRSFVLHFALLSGQTAFQVGYTESGQTVETVVQHSTATAFTTPVGVIIGSLKPSTTYTLRVRWTSGTNAGAVVADHSGDDDRRAAVRAHGPGRRHRHGHDHPAHLVRSGGRNGLQDWLYTRIGQRDRSDSRGRHHGIAHLDGTVRQHGVHHPHPHDQQRRRRPLVRHDQQDHDGCANPRRPKQPRGGHGDERQHPAHLDGGYGSHGLQDRLHARQRH